MRVVLVLAILALSALCIFSTASASLDLSPLEDESYSLSESGDYSLNQRISEAEAELSEQFDSFLELSAAVEAEAEVEQMGKKKGGAKPGDLPPLPNSPPPVKFPPLNLPPPNFELPPVNLPPPNFELPPPVNFPPVNLPPPPNLMSKKMDQDRIQYQVYYPNKMEIPETNYSYGNANLRSIILQLQRLIFTSPYEVSLLCLNALAKIAFMAEMPVKVLLLSYFYGLVATDKNNFLRLEAIPIINILKQIFVAYDEQLKGINISTKLESIQNQIHSYFPHLQNDFDLFKGI